MELGKNIQEELMLSRLVKEHTTPYYVLKSQPHISSGHKRCC